MQPDNGPGDDGNGGGRKPWEKSNTLPHKSNTANGNNGSGGNGQGSNGGAESPRPSRKRFGSASEETILKVREREEKKEVALIDINCVLFIFGID